MQFQLFLKVQVRTVIVFIQVKLAPALFLISVPVLVWNFGTATVSDGFDSKALCRSLYGSARSKVYVVRRSINANVCEDLIEVFCVQVYFLS